MSSCLGEPGVEASGGPLSRGWEAGREKTRPHGSDGRSEPACRGRAGSEEKLQGEQSVVSAPPCIPPLPQGERPCWCSSSLPTAKNFLSSRTWSLGYIHFLDYSNLRFPEKKIHMYYTSIQLSDIQKTREMNMGREFHSISFCTY